MSSPEPPLVDPPQAPEPHDGRRHLHDEPEEHHGRRHLRHLDTRIQGEDLGRIVSLSDGVFAFALTLLVLSLTVPVSKTPGVSLTNGQLGAALNHDWGVFVAYAFAFVMIALWWSIHNRTFYYIAKFDSTLVWLNLLLLAQIAVMPFILSVFATYGIGQSNPLQYAIVLFAAVQATLGATGTAIWEYARRAKLTRPGISDEISDFFTRRGLYTSAVFVISIGISFYSVGYAELSWIAIFFVQRMLTVRGD